MTFLPARRAEHPKLIATPDGKHFGPMPLFDFGLCPSSARIRETEDYGYVIIETLH
jgi:hypothetical protein